MFCLAVITFCLVSFASGGHQQEATSCLHNEKRQSPIDIVTQNVTDCDPQQTTLNTQNYEQDVIFKAENTGHSVKFSVDEEIYIEGGGLQQPYKLLQFHFHWGSSDIKGSEHRINNRTFPLELHFVHKVLDTTNTEQANNHQELAVIGVLFEISEQNNTDLQPLLRKFSAIKHVSEKTEYVQIRLSNLLPSGGFYRYSGSLTTPPCTETVVWTVMKQMLTVSTKQMEEFRELVDGFEHRIQNNNRDIQEIGERSVYSC